MDPNTGRLALNLAMVLLVLDLIALPFVDVNSGEFFIALVGIIVLVLFITLVSIEIRREVKAASIDPANS
ncbi:MAG: hypothetical protein HA496_05765 [Thaumarchaeota archaeon]|jgi:hypothetical protein|nr:hypothetical protein [Nitrososphaerota archaeon]